MDTATHRIDRFDFDPVSGDIRDRREFVTIRDGGGRPDGLTVDREGAVWVATWPGWGAVSTSCRGAPAIGTSNPFLILCTAICSTNPSSVISKPLNARECHHGQGKHTFLSRTDFAGNRIHGKVSGAIEYIVDYQDVRPTLIILDYLQRIRRERTDGDTMREQFMSIVDHAKDLALAFGAPVILGTQSKRDVKSRKWMLPQPADGQETSNLEQSADSLLSVWMPKQDYPTGHILQYGDDSYCVSDNLLILGILKQKLGPAPRIIPLHVQPEVNEISERKNQYAT